MPRRHFIDEVDDFYTADEAPAQLEPEELALHTESAGAEAPGDTDDQLVDDDELELTPPPDEGNSAD